MRRISLKGNSARIGLLLLVGWLALGCGGSESALVPVATTPSPGAVEAAIPSETPATVAATPALQLANTPIPTSPVAGSGVASEIASDTLLGTIQLKTAVVKLARDGMVSILNEGEDMASCIEPVEDCSPSYGMYFSPNRAAYIYAFQQDSTGKIDTLFPSKYSDQSNPVPANTVVWVPNDPDHWFYLDENVGQETIFVVAASERIDDLEKLAGNVQGDDGGSTDATAQLVSWLENPDRGVGGVRKQVVSARLPGGKPEEESLEVLVLEATGENQFVYQITFRHVASSVLQ